MPNNKINISDSSADVSHSREMSNIETNSSCLNIRRKKLIYVLLAGLTIVTIILSVTIPLVLNARKAKDTSNLTDVEASTTKSPEMVAVYSSALTPSTALYVRHNTPWPNAGFRYQPVRLDVEEAGVYTILSSSTMDMHGYIYEDTFDPLFPYVNLLLEDADAAGNGQFKFTIALRRSLKYIIVVTTQQAAKTGKFSLIVYGPPPVSLSLAVTPVPDIIQWLFDGNLNDVYGRYNGVLKGNTTNAWMSPGYAGYGSAARFLSNTYMVAKQRDLDLSSTKLTVSAWIWIPINFWPYLYDFIVFSYCTRPELDLCLEISVNGGNLVVDFFKDAFAANTFLATNQWYHIAYSYDPLTLRQRVYVNGIDDGGRTAKGAFQGTADSIAVGVPRPKLFVLGINGFIDKLTFESRVKSPKEILDEATLVAHYPFDNSYDDVGPNQMMNSSFLSTTFDSSGRFDQCLLINSTGLSYFQVTGFYHLGRRGHSFSFSLWIYPFINAGTIILVTSKNGWCVPTIGFDSSSRLTIQTLGINGIYSSSFTSGTISPNQWTHIAMTYSSALGIRLFVNGSFANKNEDPTYFSTDSRHTIVVGTCLSPNTCSYGTTQIVPSQFQGKIDELKIFSRELSSSEIAELAQVTTPYEYGADSLWLFDNNTSDSISNLHGIAINSPSYVTSGIAGNGYALKFDRSKTQYVTISTTNRSLASVSFTIEMWIYPTNLTNGSDFGLFSQGDSPKGRHFLYLTISKNILRMGFYHDDLIYITKSQENTWYHLAFVYDYRSSSQYIYINGDQRFRRYPVKPYLGNDGPIYIGTYREGTYYGFDGIIDNVALTMRTKTDTEILDDATLMAWHSFDSMPWKDSSSFGLIATANNVRLVPGKVNQALYFNSSSSYYQISRFVLLGISDRSYSISLWVKRATTGGGVLVHLSTQENGAGRCTTLMGFQSTGEIFVSNDDFSNIEIVGLLLPINVWTHIAVTYSSRSGQILYINGMFYGTTGQMSYKALGETIILTLGNSLDGSLCYRGSITSDVYVGDIDEFRVYSRELNTMEVYELANP